MDENILGEKRANELKELVQGGVPVKDALIKVWPRKKVEPIYDAWDYLVKEGIIVFGDEDKRGYKEPQQKYK